MPDFKKLRDHMVDSQLVGRGISDERVLDAMRKVPREHFFPDEMKEFAYNDGAFPIGEGQTISQPYMVALMTELLELEGKEKVLEIGTGSGYQAAILAELAGEVFSIERVPELAEKAMDRLTDLRYKNIEIKTGDGTLGLPEEAPFDAVMITAAAASVPQALLDQLSDNGGILVAPLGDRYSQMLTKITKYGNEILTEESVACVFVPLIGGVEYKD